MIHREYIVKFMSANGNAFPCDLMLETPGLQSKPVASAATYGAGNVTAAPTDWVTACGNNAYYELRGRTLRIPVRSGASGFTPRFNLGFHLAAVPLSVTGQDAYGLYLPRFTLSASLIATPGDSNVITGVTALADPTYGPVIRVAAQASQYDVSTKLYLISLDVFEDTDEDDSRGVR